MPTPLTANERRDLLFLARAAIADRLLEDRSLDRALAAITVTPPLEAARGSFVTLKVPDPSGPSGGLRLRGCIGALTSQDPLYRGVIQNAAKAAFEDPRFTALGRDELSQVLIAVSVLTPPVPVAGPSSIVVGRDGVVLEKGAFHSVFLPDVAVEQNWGIEPLLEHLALKAGLRRDGWKDAALSTFQAEAFEEE